MSEILFQYHRVHPATWVYLSSLLLIGLYFKFNRFWSVRNFDLVLLVLLSPGLLLVQFGGAARQAAIAALEKAGREVPAPELADDIYSGRWRSSAPAADGLSAQADRAPNPVPAEDDSADQPVAEDDSIMPPLGRPPVLVALQADDSGSLERQYARAVINERFGYLWLLTVGAFWLLRMLIDCTMVRRPLLEPNLSIGGLVWIGSALFVFLMANVLASVPTDDDLQGPRNAVSLLLRKDQGDHGLSLRRHGPSYALLSLLPSLPTVTRAETTPQDVVPLVNAAKAMAILAHAMIVLGLVAIGARHFNNWHTGIGMATLYLMIPYTAVMTGRVDHALPGALLVWAILCYRRPLVAGVCLGLAAGTVYYPLFLLPLWISFYWRRGLVRFLIGLLSMLALLVGSLALVSADFASFAEKVRVMFGIFAPRTGGLEGLWGLGWNPLYRIPVMALFIVLSFTLALWPAQKNLGTLMSCSAAVMISTQFWHGTQGGIYLAWYLPLLILTVFRPNLEDRIALAVLGEGRLRWRLKAVGSLVQAA
ncbi:MAG: hypothetical protein KatS3mg110_1587 [Pirellulaceae bacterium]|nr:MAG: hypothetical protein KatS3mg110_1587 [Pirellulaceae bacterium]